VRPLDDLTGDDLRSVMRKVHAPIARFVEALLRSPFCHFYAEGDTVLIVVNGALRLHRERLEEHTGLIERSLKLQTGRDYRVRVLAAAKTPR